MFEAIVFFSSEAFVIGIVQILILLISVSIIQNFKHTSTENYVIENQTWIHCDYIV